MTKMNQWHFVLGVLCALAVVHPAPVAAQRQPVLKQVKLPHNYYFREMYLPQVTSGPSAVAWGADGQTLVYAMQGSLWRQRIGDSVAEQLTTGPGYDYQPDVSPDGTQVVYASYRDDAVELRLFDLATLVSRPLVSDGAVNVEPRWSPDGSQIAFVSTAYEGRFHVFVVSAARRLGGSAADPSGGGVAAPPLPNPVRLTEDHDSGLPRYYYSRYDHYISPTWSPDGKELLVVSNRGKIWGSGGIWRLPVCQAGRPTACPPDRLTALLDEESTWRMRPDWALDGRRVVYASYLGRQWHQLWLTTADGGDPLQLTYGDFDATSPRWAPDGRRIAYISNEAGNTALWVVGIPGGSRQKIEARRRVYREPVGRLTISVVDAVTGRPTPARVSVTLSDGRGAAPDDAWRHGDEAFDRKQRRFEATYFHTSGRSALTVPAGQVSIEVSRGPEWRVVRERVTVAANGSVERTIRLARLVRLPGWTSGDLHVHMNYGGHYRASPASLALQARAEGLNLVENLIVNKEDRVPDVSYFTGRPDPVSTPDLMILHDQEFHTSWWGHTAAIGLTKHLLLPDYSGYAGTAVASLYPDNATVADQARAQGGLLGYVHPFDEAPNLSDSAPPFTYALPVDVALGRVDYLEVMGFSDHLITSRVWYRLLNCGFRVPAGAGTDAMTNYASLRGPLGTTRVYVESPLPLDRARWYAALKAGKTFVTNGPVLQFSVGGIGPGGEVTLPAGSHRLALKIMLRSNLPVEHLEVIGAGEVIATIPLRGDRTSVDTTIMVPVSESGWFVLRSWSAQPAEPILDLYPFASTSPVYVSVAGKPVRSPADAEYFLRWIDRLVPAAESHPGWNTAQEKREVLERLRAAREKFELRRAP